jgi:hypothetical protein
MSKLNTPLLWVLLVMALPVGAAEPPGKVEVRAAVFLLDEGVRTINEWALKSTDPYGAIGALREACGCLTVGRELLTEGSRSEDPGVVETSAGVTKGADMLARLIDLALAPNFDDSGSWEHEVLSVSVAYDNNRKSFPLWSITLLGRDELRVKYRAQVDAAVRTMIAQGACKPTNQISAEELARKRDAWAARNAGLDRQHKENVARKDAEAAELRRQYQEAQPADLAVVATWHKKVYTPKIMPLKRAFSRLLLVDRNRRTEATKSACGDLFNAVDGLTGRGAIPSGAPAIDQVMAPMLKTYKSASEACLSGNMKSFNVLYQQGEKELGLLARALAPYKLQP